MLVYIARRLLSAIPALLAVVTLAFFVMRLAPGNPFESGRRLSPEVERHVLASYGMDRPLGAQYVSYLEGVLHGDFGPSLKYRDKSVRDIILQGLPKSAILGLSALSFAVAAGVPLGVLAALQQNRATDAISGGLAVVGMSIPAFVTAPLLVLVFASWLGWLPTAGWGGPSHLLLPVLVLALPQVAIISRLMRAGMIEVWRSNYIRTAKARGLPTWRIVTRHAVRGAVAPLVSYLGPACAGLITGSLVVEEIFGLPGLGRAFVTGALQRDYTVVMGVVILYGVLILALNLAADIAHILLDPRLRLA